MEIQLILTFSLLLLASVELSETNKTYSYVDLTANDYLRKRHEMTADLLDLNGSIRKRFLYTVTSNGRNVISAVCSPFSAMMPLGMLLLGAGHEKTDKNLRYALGMNMEEEAPAYFKYFLNGIQGLPDAHTELANRMYISDENELKSNFVEAAKDILDSGVQSINMKDRDKVAKEVNNWVRKNTKGKIKQILHPSDVSPSTVVLVANAIYFSALWEKPFKYSEEDVFYGVDGQQKVDLMSNKAYYMYGKSSVLNAKAIIIPYRGDDAAMLVLLPHARDGLYSLLNQLKKDPDLINTIIMQFTYVDLELPKFKIETSLDLKHLYKKVGLTEIFNNGHGLHDMVENSTVFLDKGIQKAFIEVTKKGTVAAAASSINIMMMSQPLDPKKPVRFRADHPFLFLIIVQKQQLFGGTFAG